MYFLGKICLIIKCTLCKKGYKILIFDKKKKRKEKVGKSMKCKSCFVFESLHSCSHRFVWRTPESVLARLGIWSLVVDTWFAPECDCQARSPWRTALWLASLSLDCNPSRWCSSTLVRIEHLVERIYQSLCSSDPRIARGIR